MIGLDTSAEAKARALDRAVLVILPVVVTYYSLAHTARFFGVVVLGGAVVAPDPSTVALARTAALAFGLLTGVPLAYGMVRLADGWGLVDEDAAEDER